MTAYRLRWRADASGFVARFAGQWASDASDDREWLAGIARTAPNGGQLEIVTVEGEGE